MPAPPQNVADSWNAAEFYANKLMMALRGKDETQMAWLKGIKVCETGAARGSVAG
jgi:adenylyl cyclase-associated protein